MKNLYENTDEYEDIQTVSHIIEYIFDMGLCCLNLYTLLRLGNFVEDKHMYQIAKSLTHHYSNECEEQEAVDHAKRLKLEQPLPRYRFVVEERINAITKIMSFSYMKRFVVVPDPEQPPE